MENQFDLGFNIASIETEFPDPVITLTGADRLTASGTAEMPLVSLTLYGRSWQGERIVNVSSVGIEGYGIAVDSGGNYIDPNGQHWICDELIVNADGSGKLVKRCEYVLITAANIISMTENASFGNFFYTNIVGAVGTDENSVKPLSNRFLGVPFGQRAIAEHVNKFRCFLSQDGRLILRNSAVDNRFTSVSQVQDFVVANETYAIYPLAEYSETELTAEQIAAVKPAFEHYGAFTAYFKSTQENEPGIGSPAEIITAEELHRISVPIESIGSTGVVKLISTDGESETLAEIVTGLPLRGVPVSNGGNYTDESGQEWVCDTIDHVYGEPAQVTRRIHTSEVIEHYDLKGGGALFIDGVFNNWYYAEHGKLYITSWGEELVKLYGAFLREKRTASGELIKVLEEWDVPKDITNNYHSSSKLIGKWTVYKDVEMLPAYELANGENVPDEFVSTTGRLSQGAGIIYPAKAEPVLLTTAETEALNGLSGYIGDTTVYNENNAEMTVKLLREDYEMQYIHWIKESQSFVCEKAGKYKIICVGGGSSGGLGALGAADTLQAVGTTTSFGTIISADGGGKTRVAADTDFSTGATVGGQSGYDGINYGSTAHVMCAEKSISNAGMESTVMWGTGHGYGAGGGAKGSRVTYGNGDGGTNVTFLAAAGKCGKVESTIVDLEENQSVFCTIGGGGVLKVSNADILEYVKNSVDSAAVNITTSADAFSACASDGADGVIIIQYLGI